MSRNVSNSLVKPNCRKWHWDVVADNALQDTVFSDILSEISNNASVKDSSMRWFTDRNGIERVFSLPEKGRSMSQSVKRNNEVQIGLSTAISQRIAIAVAKFKLPLEELAEKLRCLDLSGLTQEDLQPLAQSVLTTEVVEAIQKCLKDGMTPQDFREQERAVIQLIQIPRVVKRCRLLLGSFELASQMKLVSQSCEVITKACKETRESSRLRHLLRRILQWGNFVNYGAESSEQFEASGFTVSSMSKLADYKCPKDTSLNGLQFVLCNMIEYEPQIGMDRLSSDLPSLPAAAALTSSDVNDHIMTCWRGMQMIQEEKVMFQKESPDKPLPKLFMECEHTTTGFESMLQSTTDLALSTCMYFAHAVKPVKRDDGPSCFCSIQQVLAPLERLRKMVDSITKEIKTNSDKFKKLIVRESDGSGLDKFVAIEALRRKETSLTKFGSNPPISTDNKSNTKLANGDNNSALPPLSNTSTNPYERAVCLKTGSASDVVLVGLQDAVEKEEPVSLNKEQSWFKYDKARKVKDFEDDTYKFSSSNLASMAKKGNDTTTMNDTTAAEISKVTPIADGAAATFSRRVTPPQQPLATKINEEPPSSSPKVAPLLRSKSSRIRRAFTAPLSTIGGIFRRNGRRDG